MSAQEQREFVVPANEAGTRLDAFLATHAAISRAFAARLIADGSTLVDGLPATKSLRVEGGMRVAVALPEQKDEIAPAPEDIPVPIVYEDEYLIVVSKPAGLVVHPAPGHPAGTLVNALLARAGAPAGGDALRPGIVHRLDAGTSGLMIVAKDEATHAALTEALAARAITRIYLALVEGIPDADSMTIDAPIGRSPRDRKKMAVVAGGRPSVTEIRVLEKHAETALVEARPITGRTHQIRVHLKAAGHPVMGDRVYGKNRKLAAAFGLDRPFLHAARLSFEQPSTGARVDLKDPLPPDLQAALEAARTRS